MPCLPGPVAGTLQLIATLPDQPIECGRTNVLHPIESMNVIAKHDFLQLDPQARLTLIKQIRNGRSNMECLQSIFGDELPPNVTDFNFAGNEAVFIDATRPNWDLPVKTIELTEDQVHQLRLVGMFGVLGWSLRKGVGLSNTSRVPTLDI